MNEIRTIDDVKAELLRLKNLTGPTIKHRQKWIQEIGTHYLINRSKMEPTEDDERQILADIAMYNGEYTAIMEEAAQIYFTSKSMVIERFGRKTGGVQAGLTLEISGHGKYYMKTQQYGSTSVSATKGELDIKELYVYRLLMILGIGPECHWFVHPRFPKSVYIATRGLVMDKLSIDREIVKLDMISRILLIHDTLSNSTNVTQHSDGFGYIIDFRTYMIPQNESAYVYRGLFSHFMAGNATVNYAENSNAYKVMVRGNGSYKVGLALSVMSNELLQFERKAIEVKQYILSDSVASEYSSRDLNVYVNDISVNYRVFKEQLPA